MKPGIARDMSAKTAGNPWDSPEVLAALLTAWHSVFGQEAVTVSEAIAHLGRLRRPLPGECDKLRALDRAMRAISSEGRPINGRRMNRYIAQHELRMEGGQYFQRVGMRGSAPAWRVVQQP